MPGLRLTGRHKLKLVGEPIMTGITGEASYELDLITFVKFPSVMARHLGLLWTWAGLW